MTGDLDVTEGGRDSMPDAAGAPLEIVVWAEGYLARLRRRLGVIAGGWTGAYAVAAMLGIPLSGVTLVLPLAAMGAVYLSPVTRAGRRAREVVRRWDRAEIERAFDEAGRPSDPRLEVAESMGRRVLGDRATEPKLEGVVDEILSGLRTTLHDLRVTALARTAEGAGASEESRGHTEAELEARIAQLFRSLTAMHEAVVTRDAACLGRTIAEAEETLAALAAERDVERMLRRGATRHSDASPDG